MKVSLKSVFNEISNKVQKARINKKEANIKKFVNFDDVKDGYVHRTLYGARETLANYAKKENVTIGFNTISYTKGETSLGVSVESKGKPSKFIAREMPIAESVYKKTISIPVENKETGTEEFLNYNYQYQDSFLRGVYRKIQNIVKEIKK